MYGLFWGHFVVGWYTQVLIGYILLVIMVFFFISTHDYGYRAWNLVPNPSRWGYLANYIVESCIMVIDFTMVINGREYSRLRTCQLPGFWANRMYDSLNCGS